MTDKGGLPTYPLGDADTVVQLLLRNIQEPFVIVGTDLRVQMMNARFTALYKKYFGIDVAVGHSILDYAQPHRRSMVTLLYAQVFRGEQQESEIEVPDATNGFATFHNKYSPLYDASGVLIGAMVTSLDITAYRSAQRLLTISERRFRALLENSGDAVIVMTAEGKPTYMSPGARSILGYSESTMEHINLFEQVHLEDMPSVTAAFALAMENPGVAVKGHIARMRHADGSWRWLNTTLNNLLHDPSIHGIVKNLRDVTERVEAQLLQEAERKDKEALINSTDELIWSLRPDLTLKAANRAFLQAVKAIAGVEPKPGESLLRKEFFPKELLAYWKAAYERGFKGERFVQEFYIPELNGLPESWSEVSFNPIEENGKVLELVCSARNITAIKHYNRRIVDILDSVTDGFYALDSHWNITYWNSQAERMQPFRRDEVLGRNIWDVYPDSEHQQFYAAFHQVMRERKPAFVLEYFESFDGWYDISIYPTKEGISVFFRDVSEKVKKERELENVTSLLRKVSDNVPGTLYQFCMAPDGTMSFPYISKGVELLVPGLRPEDVYADASLAFSTIHPDDLQDFLASVEVSRQQLTPWSYEYRAVLESTQEIRWIRGISSPERLEDGTVVWHGFLQDITRQHHDSELLHDFADNLERKVDIRTAELAAAHSIVQQHYAHIRSSLEYAKRIQQAVLTNENQFQALCPDSFVLMQPRDVVSGDFFWCSETEAHRFIAVVDCTGHGLPGALLSMVGHQLLTNIVMEVGISSPKRILRHLSHRLVRVLNHDQTPTKLADGMELALCSMNKATGQLCFAGANRPLFIADGTTVRIIPGSKRSIGGDQASHVDSDFAEHTLTLSPNSMIYLTTDGYYDQFGGAYNGKMLKKRFMETLQEIQALPTDQQLAKLRECFEQWRGDSEQLDDVLVLGVRC